MIYKLTGNLMKALSENKGVCQSGMIRVGVDEVETFFDNHGIDYNNYEHIAQLLQNAFGDAWYVTIANEGDTIQICELPDNWVRAHIDSDGDVANAYYV